jgi:hypothetical protein
MRRHFFVLPFIVLAGLGFSGMHRAFPWPYPTFDQLMTHRSGLQDVSLMTAGFRPLAADLAWIELLQYVGGGFLPGEDRTRGYAELESMTLRVTRIDPYFRHAYLYSGSMLAFFRNINRPQEALDVLFEGIKNNPEYWPLRTTAAAIGFQKADQFDRMALALEASIQYPDCPSLVKSILANGYKAHHRPRDAIRIWENVLSNPKDELYHAKAEQEIKGLEKSVS